MIAAIALFTLIVVDPLILGCALGSHQATSKSDGLWFGIGLFMFVPAAIFGALLSLPAILRHPRLWWPYVGFVLGIVPLLILVANWILRVFGLL